MPLLSLVVPTTGKPKNLFRCLDSITQNASPTLLKKTELIVFVNPDPGAPINEKVVTDYINGLSPLFASVKFSISPDFKLTAEESAYAATSEFAGDYLWISGDARIYLPDGLRELENWLNDPQTPCAFFNSTWLDVYALKQGNSSLHATASRAVLSYKQFVMHAGINFMPTSMGACIFERRFLDRDAWQEIITTCGPHFSHITAYLAALKDTPMTFMSTYLYMVEPKAYHSGDDSEWARYASLAGTYRYYAWNLGLMRQFTYLSVQGVYSYSDVRRSMCSEGLLIRRQVDEIYNNLLLQLRLGWAKHSERITSAELDEILDFLSRVCPEKAVVNYSLRQIHDCYASKQRDQFTRLVERVSGGIMSDHFEARLSTAIIGQVGDKFIRLHPRGYLVSPVNDDRNFLLAYKLLDAPEFGAGWKIYNEEQFPEVQSYCARTVLPSIFPSLPSGNNQDGKSKIRKVGEWLNRRGTLYWVFVRLPYRWQLGIKNLFR